MFLVPSEVVSVCTLHHSVHHASRAQESNFLLYYHPSGLFLAHCSNKFLLKGFKKHTEPIAFCSLCTVKFFHWGAAHDFDDKLPPFLKALLRGMGFHQ